jgi:hypothetical protein
VVVADAAFSLIGWTSALLPATSQAAKRTHFFLGGKCSPKTSLLARRQFRDAVGAYVGESHVSAATSPMNCNLSSYQGASGLNASANGDSLVLTWDGDRNQELRLRFVIDNGTPTVGRPGRM